MKEEVGEWEERRRGGRGIRGVEEGVKMSGSRRRKSGNWIGR